MEMPNFPIVKRSIIHLVGDPELSNFRGPYECAWIHWPVFGVSFLHSMTKVGSARQ